MRRRREQIMKEGERPNTNNNIKKGNRKHPIKTGKWRNSNIYKERKKVIKRNMKTPNKQWKEKKKKQKKGDEKE